MNPLFIHTYTHTVHITVKTRTLYHISSVEKSGKVLILCMNCEVNPLLFCAVNKSSRCLAKFNLLSQNAELDTSQLSLQ